MMISSISPFQLLLLVHDCLLQAHFGIFEIRVEFQSLLEVTLCIVEKSCKNNNDSIKIKYRPTFITITIILKWISNKSGSRSKEVIVTVIITIFLTLTKSVADESSVVVRNFEALVLLYC